MTATRIELPSGLWAGHYVQFFVKHAQKMTLEFADGLIRGDGVDGIGAFTIEGEYRVARGEARLGWIKTYEQAHSVLYLGTLQGDSIVGHWKLAAFGSGAFSLSPATNMGHHSKKTMQ